MKILILNGRICSFNGRICFLMKQSRTRECEENNGLINFNWALIRRKKAREIKDTRQRHKLKI